MRNTKSTVGLSALLVLIGVLCPTLTNAAPQIATVDGVPHISNCAKAAGDLETLHLEELWRTGGEDDDIFYGTGGFAGRMVRSTWRLSEMNIGLMCMIPTGTRRK
jgi:hypothetical protein